MKLRAPSQDYQPPGDLLFRIVVFGLAGFYVVFVLALLLSMFTESVRHPLEVFGFLNTPEIRYSLTLTLLSSLVCALLSVLVAVPLGYVMSRHTFRGKAWVDAVLDVPIVLPPLVVGLALLMFFMTPLGRAIERVVPVTYAVPSVVIAQFTVAAAFAVRLMRSVFEQINPRYEQVALTMGCSRGQAFLRVLLPQTTRGMVAAGTLAWARALGEFGPILLFAGATRMRTEVLSTTIFLEMSVGNLQGALSVSMLMVVVSMLVLVVIRKYGGMERLFG